MIIVVICMLQMLACASISLFRWAPDNLLLWSIAVSVVGFALAHYLAAKGVLK